MRKLTVECENFSECDGRTPCRLVEELLKWVEDNDKVYCINSEQEKIDWSDA